MATHQVINVFISSAKFDILRQESKEIDSPLETVPLTSVN